MRAFNVKVIDAAGQLHRYVQIAANAQAAEAIAWDRFGLVRTMSVARAAA